MYRVDALADRPAGYMPSGAIPYKNLIPFDEIIADAKGVGKGSVVVEREYRSYLARFANEFDILLKASAEELNKGLPPRLAEGVLKVRQGQVEIKAGFDGEYGIISIFGDENKTTEGEKQLSLF
jgi:PHP family Zn ribbon phosphoesterase